MCIFKCKAATKTNEKKRKEKERTKQQKNIIKWKRKRPEKKYCHFVKDNVPNAYTMLSHKL